MDRPIELTAESLWNEVAGRLKGALNETTYRTWFAEAKAADTLRDGRALADDDHAEAEGHRLAQYQAWDMLVGRMWPQIGGDPKYLDVVGVNFYYNNQRVHGAGRGARIGCAEQAVRRDGNRID